jgi:Domain of unknown function (DUF4136)
MIKQASLSKTIACAVAVSVVCGGLGACTTLRVTSDVNQPLAGTVRCQSFDWAGSFQGSSDSLRSTIANPVNEARLRAAIQANLGTVGVHPAGEGADCLVGYGIGQRNVVDGYPGYYGGFGWGGGWGGRHGGWGGYGAWGWDYPYTYQEGVIGVDVYDGKSKQALWHASVNQNLNGVTGDKADKKIKDAVAAIFAKYPKT